MTEGTTAKLTPHQRRLLRILDSYDEVIKFDTRDGNVKRTLKSLADKGLVEIQPDIFEDQRWWALKVEV